MDLIGGAGRQSPTRAGMPRCRGIFDKAVSSEPLVFAADAGPMGFQCCFGTSVLFFGGNSIMPGCGPAKHGDDPTPMGVAKQGRSWYARKPDLYTRVASAAPAAYLRRR